MMKEFCKTYSMGGAGLGLRIPTDEIFRILRK